MILRSRDCSRTWVREVWVGQLAIPPITTVRIVSILAQLTDFLRFTQPAAAKALRLGDDNPTRRKFLARLEGEVTKRGTIDVLRNGVKHGPHHLDLFYGTPSPDNEKAKDRFEQNRFTVTRQLRYSQDETQRSLDLALFINGLPVLTFELKNSLTKQTVSDAIHQYRRDRDPAREAFRSGPVFGAFCGGRHPGLLLYPPAREGLGIPALQSGGGATEPAILPIPTDWRSITCGERCCPAKVLPT